MKPVLAQRIEPHTALARASRPTRGDTTCLAAIRQNHADFTMRGPLRTGIAGMDPVSGEEARDLLAYWEHEAAEVQERLPVQLAHAWADAWVQTGKRSPTVSAVATALARRSGKVWPAAEVRQWCEVADLPLDLQGEGGVR